MGAQNSDVVALLSVFVGTGLGIALVLLVVSTSIAALLALARGGSPQGYLRECAECLPRAALIVALSSALIIVGYAAIFGR